MSIVNSKVTDHIESYSKIDAAHYRDLITTAAVLEAENLKLKAIIKELHEKVDAKNRIINRLQHDSWDDVSYDREDR